MNFDVSERRAIGGSQLAVQTPIPHRKRHGEIERRYLCEVIDSDIVNRNNFRTVVCSATDKNRAGQAVPRFS